MRHAAHRRFVPTALYTLLAGCGAAASAAPPPAAPAPAPVSIIVASPSPTPTPVVVTPAATPTCTATLTVESSAISQQTCHIDARITGRPGTLSYPCGGGAAVARFDSAEFTGSVTADGAVSLTLATRFPFSDGCQWQSTQRIEGPLGSRRVGYQYDEAALPGQQGCAPSCQAAAVLDVQ